MIFVYIGSTILVAAFGQRIHVPVARIAVYVGLALLLSVGPVLGLGSDATLNTLADAGIFVLLALGLNIVVGFAGLLDLGYAAFFAIGAYTYAMLASPQFGVHLPFWVLLFVGAALAGAFGIILGSPTLRLRGDYLAIVTLGFGEIVPQVFQNLTRFTGGPNGIAALDFPSLFGRSFGTAAFPYYEVTLGLIGVALVTARNLRSSRIGRAWMAIREDELAARHLGINTTRMKLAAFAIGAAFAGVGGVVYAAKLSLVSPDLFQFQVSILVLSMLVLGGMGNIAGVVIGSLVLTLVNQVILPQSNVLAQAAHLPVNLSNAHFFIYGGILVAIMLFRPEGLLPSAQRQAELHESVQADGV